MTTVLTRHNTTTEPHQQPSDDRDGGEMLSNSKLVWSNVNTLHGGWMVVYIEWISIIVV